MTPDTAPIPLGDLATVVLDRSLAIYDIYGGLRTIGYSRLGALRALRAVGVPLADGKRASDTYEAGHAAK